MLDSQNLTINAHFRILFPFLICLFPSTLLPIVFGSFISLFAFHHYLFAFIVSIFLVESSVDPSFICCFSMESSQLGKKWTYVN